jgi:hypothetical protein
MQGYLDRGMRGARPLVEPRRSLDRGMSGAGGLSLNRGIDREPRRDYNEWGAEGKGYCGARRE